MNDTSPDPGFYLNLARQHRAGADYRKAGEACAAALQRLDSGDPVGRRQMEFEIYRELAAACYFAGEYGRACEAYRKILALLPDDVDREGRRLHRCFHNEALGKLEFLENRVVLESKPRNMIVAVTNDCNLRCLMCPFNREHREPWELPGRAAEELMALLPALLSMHWMGGEVFLSRRFAVLFDEAARYPCLTQSIQTNGLLVGPEWARKLVDGNVNISMSIDGAAKETYERIRRGASFDRLCANLDYIREYRRSAAGSRFRLVLDFVVMESNRREIVSMVEFARRYGVDEVQFNELKPCGDPAVFDRERVRDADGLRDTLARAAQRAQELGVRFSDFTERGAGGTVPAESGTAARPPRHAPCIEPWRSLFLRPDGLVTVTSPCTVALGNIRDTSIEDIWNGPPMQAHRRRLIAGNCEIQPQCAPYMPFTPGVME